MRFILVKFQRPIIYALPFLFTDGCSSLVVARKTVSRWKQMRAWDKFPAIPQLTSLRALGGIVHLAGTSKIIRKSV